MGNPKKGDLVKIIRPVSGVDQVIGMPWNIPEGTIMQIRDLELGTTNNTRDMVYTLATQEDRYTCKSYVFTFEPYEPPVVNPCDDSQCSIKSQGCGLLSHVTHAHKELDVLADAIKDIDLLCQAIKDMVKVNNNMCPVCRCNVHEIGCPVGILLKRVGVKYGHN